MGLFSSLSSLHLRAMFPGVFFMVGMEEIPVPIVPPPPLPAVEPQSLLNGCLTVAGAGSQAPSSQELSPGPRV